MKPRIYSKQQLLSKINNSNKEYINNIIQKIGFSPLSGSELNYNPNKWNNNNNIKLNHNCYAYALGKIRPKLKSKPQPGYFINYPGLYNSDYKCNTFYERIMKENPLAYKIDFNKPCKKGFHKIYLAIDQKDEDKDYHFYRQDKSGYWSHKPGRQKVVNYDAKGKKIKNPENANRNYNYYKYKKSCGFLCVNKNISRSRSKK